MRLSPIHNSAEPATPDRLAECGFIVLSQYSLLRGSSAVADWGRLFRGLWGAPNKANNEQAALAEKRGGNYPASLPRPLRRLPSLQVQPPRRPRVTEAVNSYAHTVARPWAILADEGDLCGVPAALEDWGRSQVGVGACLPLCCPEGQAVVVCLAPDQAAYRQLCRLLSWRAEATDAWRMWLHSPWNTATAVDWRGITVLCDQPALFARLRHQGAEVIPHARETPWQDEKAPLQNEPVAIPLLAGISDTEAQVQQLLQGLNQRSGSSLNGQQAAWDTVTPLFFNQLDQWLARFEHHPEQIARGLELLQRCSYRPGEPLANGMPYQHMPRSDHAEPDAELERICLEGCKHRYDCLPNGDLPNNVITRLERELKVIREKNFSSYILAVWELTRERRTCGRGSAASSLVCYALGITNVDPIHYQLVFERFLNEERRDPPDIDVDFPWDERNDVHLAALERYGREHVAMVATHQFMSERGALREAGRLHQRSQQAISEYAKAQRHLRHWGDQPGQSNTSSSQGTDNNWDAVHADATLLAGLPRCWGLHCGGIVISEQPIRELVPIHPASKQIGDIAVPAIAWEKDGAEAMGLVKIDLLGNRSLAVVRDCLQDLARDGIVIDELRWRPTDDPLTKRLIERGQTIGCFYIESPAMRLLNARAGTVDFDRLVVHSSIIRPAANAYINAYIERLHYFKQTGQHDPEWYPHDVLRGLLSESFGILSYQEDVMLVARELAGFGIQQQDQLRKALGRADTPKRLAALEPAFSAGCRERGVGLTVRNIVWKMISSFAGYSFCKAHSASYAMVSYQCAWLKTHYPAYFMARVIANEGGFYHRSAYIEEARRCGINILPPCVLSSNDATQAINASALRLGWHCVKGLSQGVRKRLVDFRQHASQHDHDALQYLQELMIYVHPSSRERQQLLHAGAFNKLLNDYSHGQRQQLIEHCHHDGQRSLFTTDVGALLERHELFEPSQCQRDRAAWEVLSCLPSAHPFALWPACQHALQHGSQHAHHCHDVRPQRSGQRLTIVAWAIAQRRVWATQRQDERGLPLREPEQRQMAFVTLEDPTSSCESVWFSACYQLYGAILEHQQPFMLSGQVVVEYGVATLQVDVAWPLGQARPRSEASQNKFREYIRNHKAEA